MDNILLMLALCISSFLSGYAAGIMWPPRKEAEAVHAQSTAFGEQTERQLQEYKNFLSYDGSVQA